MKFNPRYFAIAALVAAAISGPVSAQAPAVTKLAPVVVEAPKAEVGPEKIAIPMQYVEIRNFQDERLGQVQDLGISLVNGRIVEVLVVSDNSLGGDQKIGATPCPVARCNQSSLPHQHQHAAFQNRGCGRPLKMG